MKIMNIQKLFKPMMVLTILFSVIVLVNHSYGANPTGAISDTDLFISNDQVLITDGISGIVPINENTSDGTLGLDFSTDSVEDANHKVKAPEIIEYYSHLYKDFAFNKAMTIIDSERFKKAAADVTFISGTSNSYISNKVTISKNNPETYGLPGSTSYWSYIHELTHKIEDDNGDIGYTAGITKYSRAYGERNIEFIENILSNAISKLEFFEADVKKGDFVQAEVRWKAFIKGYEDAIQSKHTEVSGAAFSPDFKLLKNWVGFDVDRHKIEDNYKSGNAGLEFKKFFERDLGKKTTLNSLKAGTYVSIGNIKFSIVNPVNGYIMHSTFKSDLGSKKCAFAENSPVDNVDPYTLRAFLDNWYKTEFPDEQKILVRDFGGKFNKAGVISTKDYKEYLEPINFFIETAVSCSSTRKIEDGNGKVIRVSVAYLYGLSWGWGSATEVWAVAPALYLNPATPILSGRGERNDPYIISYKNTTLNNTTTANDDVRPIVTTPEKRTYPTGLPGLDFANKFPPALYNNRTIKLQISNSTASINNKKTSLDATPEIVNNRTFVPLRFIAESLGAHVDYIPNYKGANTVVISGAIDNHEDYIILFIGSTNVLHNQSAEKLEAAPYVKNGRTFVPIRFVSEKFGAKVDWNGQTSEISISR